VHAIEREQDRERESGRASKGCVRCVLLVCACFCVRLCMCDCVCMCVYEYLQLPLKTKSTHSEFF